MSDEPYTDKIVPLPDASMRYFEEALMQSCDGRVSKRRIREILRQCWRDIRNS